MSRAYNITKIKERNSKKFGVKVHDFYITFNDFDGGDRPYHALYECFRQIFRDIVAQLGNATHVRLVFHCDSLDFPISLPFVPVNELTASMLYDECERVLQSYKTINLAEENMRLNVQSVAVPKIGGRSHSRQRLLAASFLNSSKSFVTCPRTDENLCLAKCLVYGLAVLKTDIKLATLHRNMRLGRGCDSELMRRAIKLQAEAGLSPTACSIKDVAAFDAHFITAYGLTIRLYDVVPDRLYNNNEYGYLPKINILVFDDHAYYIKSMKTLFGTSYYCAHCDIGFDHSYNHASCPYRCVICHEKDCSNTRTEKETKTECEQCGLSYYTAACFLSHKKSACNIFLLCGLCHKKIRRTKWNDHIGRECQVSVCLKCGSRYHYDDAHSHVCYMLPLDIEKYRYNSETDNSFFIYMDFESQFLEDGSHCVNLVCYVCQDESKGYFYGKDKCLIDLLKYLCSKARENPQTSYTVISHGGGSYDMILLLEAVHQQGMSTRTLIYRQSKILFMELLSNLRFVDSLNYFQTKLANLASMYDLTTVKGTFPFWSNRDDMLFTDTSYPSLSEYNPKLMASTARKAFVARYDKDRVDFIKQGRSYNYFEQLLLYCQADCDCLKAAVECYEKIHIRMTGIKPFIHRFTFPGELLLYYRCVYLRYDQLMLIGADSLSCMRQTSAIAETWLSWMSYKLKCNIRSKNRGSEVRFGNRWLDGVAETDDGTKIAFEFFGCFFHSHDCDKSRRTGIHPWRKIPHELVRARDQQFLDSLTAESFLVHSIYECEFRAAMETDPLLIHFLTTNGHHIFKHIDVKQAMLGARTDAFRLRVVSDDLNKMTIKSWDLISSYGAVLKEPYPCSKVEIIEGCNIEKPYNLNLYFGLIRCSVHPPVTHLMPVLPIRHNGKLIFGLCGTCIKEDVTDFCRHTFNERLIEWTWTTVELKLAVEEGYMIVDIFEVWHWKSQSSDLFGKYIDSFYLEKVKASGVPASCITAEQLNNYLGLIERDTGVRLQPEQLKFSKALRNMAKTNLLSLWGAVCSELPGTKTFYLSDVEQFYRILADDTQKLQDLLIVSDSKVMVTVKDLSQPYHMGRTSSFVVGIWTLSIGRIRLFKLLQGGGFTSAISCDTDGGWFSATPGERPVFPSPLTTDLCLGGVSDELANKYSPTTVCRSLRTVGPKNYHAHLVDPSRVDEKGNMWEEHIYRVRGITFNFYSEQVVNFENMDRLLQDSDLELKVLTPSKIVRLGKGRGIKNKPEERKYRFRFTKRLVDFSTPDLKTYPIGWSYSG